MKKQTEKSLAKIVENVMRYKPPKDLLKKPLKAQSKAELSKAWNLKM